MSYAEVARRANIERTQLLKMKSGERPGDEHMVASLCDVLMLSAVQADELRRLFLIARMGDDVYARHQFVKTLLEQMGRLPGALPLAPPAGRRLDTLPDSIAVSGRGAVLDLLRVAVEQESAREDARIRLVAQPEEGVLMDALAAAGRGNRALHVEHVVCFQQGVEKNGENRYNLDCFRGILPLFTSGCRYDSYYYYDEIAVRFNDASLLPYLLLTSDCCVGFSKDLEHALFSRVPDSMALCAALFAKLQRHAKPLVTLIPDAVAHIQAYSSFQAFSTDSDKEFYSFFTGPCLALFYDEAMLARYVNRDMPHADVVISQYTQMIREIYTVMRTIHMTSYFSEAGLDYFLKSGRVVEIPDEYYHPLSKGTCLHLLQAMLDHAGTGLYRPVMVDTSKFRMPDNLVISAMREDVVKMIYMHPQYGALVFTIEEPSLSYAVYDFMGYLKTSNLVCPKERTLAAIRGRLAQTPEASLAFS